MTELLEKAFHKVSGELSEVDQNKLATLLLENSSHRFLGQISYRIEDYNKETQAAFKEAEERKKVSRYQAVDEMFSKLDL